MLSIKALIPTIVALATSANASPVADPLAFADAVGIPVGEASYACHASCGNMIIAARSCTPGGASDSGYDSACLCASNSQFMGLSDACLACGWCLWSDYSKYLTSPLGLCNLPTNPTGTDCAPSTAAPTTTAPATTAPTTTTTPAGTTTTPAGTTTTPAGTTTAPAGTTTTPVGTTTTQAGTTPTPAGATTSSSTHVTSSSSVPHVTTAQYHNGTTSTVTSTVCSSCHVSASVQTFTGAAAQVGVAGLAALAGAAAFLM